MEHGFIKSMRWMRFLLTIPLSLAVFSICAEEAKLLSLHDAILLSLRYNASVRTAELKRVTDKFALDEAKWAFQPHYSFGASNTWSNGASDSQYKPMSQSWSAQPGVSWNSSYGTQVSVDNSWGLGGNPSVSVNITQPLISGFGRAVTEAALEQAYDNEKANKLALKQAIMTQVTATITAYMNLVESENNVDVDQQAVDRAKTNLFQTNILIHAGQNPQSDEIQAQAQVAQALSQLQQNKSQLVTARYALLQAIGLDPNTNIRILHDVPLEQYHLLPQDQSIKATLENNVNYQTSIFTIAAAARTVMTSEDANRWQLNLTETYSRGGGGPPPPSSLAAADTDGLVGGGANSILNNHNYGSITALNLKVPIDSLQNKDNIISAKIALEEAQLNLNQGKQNLILQVMSNRDSLVNSATQVQLDADQVKYDEQALANVMRSYRAGMSSSLQVTQLSQTYATDQRSVVTAEIGYFNALAAFDQLYGHTLETWGIHIQN